MKNNSKTALVTGANSGIGLETVRQLSDLDYSHIILVCRTIKKGESTIQKLVNEGYYNIYSLLAIDLSDVNSSHQGLQELLNKKRKIDLIILNACVSPANLTKNNEGMEITFASSLLGHHIIANGLLNANLLSDDARIVTAGSEAARGDVPMISLPDIDSIIQEKFNGDQYKALKSLMFPESIQKYSSMKTYAVAKLYVSLWTSAFSRKLKNNSIVNSISPGATPNTNFARHQSLMIRKIMMPMMKFIGPSMGMSGTLTDAAKRYLKILEFEKQDSGKFWVSKKGKMAGPIVVYSSPYLSNKSYQDNVWDIVNKVSLNKND